MTIFLFAILTFGRLKHFGFLVVHNQKTSGLLSLWVGG